MSKPSKPCVFCHQPKPLNKSHIWPEWCQKIIPSTSNEYEIALGQPPITFEPRAHQPEPYRKIKPGSVADRRPRNTCGDCNQGWMKKIEEDAKPAITALLLGQPFLLDHQHQAFLAAFLCLVSMRIAANAYGMRPIPDSDYDHIRTTRAVPREWKIWIARYDSGVDHFFQGFWGMQRLPAPPNPMPPTGREYCNTQVTTLIVGQLCAHLFSSTVWPNFPGYERIKLTQIWPQTGFNIDTRYIPPISKKLAIMLHETVAREGNPPEGFIIGQ